MADRSVLVLIHADETAVTTATPSKVIIHNNLPISLGLHLVLDFLLTFKVSVGHPMRDAFMFPRSHHVQDKLVHHPISKGGRR